MQRLKTVSSNQLLLQKGYFIFVGLFTTIAAFSFLLRLTKRDNFTFPKRESADLPLSYWNQKPIDGTLLTRIFTARRDDDSKR
jgi:hypothetical protein